MDLFNQQGQILTVSELTREIKTVIETNLGDFWVRGEISNFIHHSSGHMYFALKDREAQISCVMWRDRNSALTFPPRDGLEVIAFGSVRVYERRGQVQFSVLELHPAGIGELALAFERLKERLREEGLFEAGQKQAIPEFPGRIGVVTSPTGAAIRDIRHVIARRYPGVLLILRPVLVQGEGAAEDIAAAIDEFNRYGEVDLLIVGRGGGSLEDLWAFNEEIVARAIYRSRIPIISAVGHEIDFTIADFVADLRAPTPSAAAEMAVPDRNELLSRVRDLESACRSSLRYAIASRTDRLEGLKGRYGFRRPADLVAQGRQRLDESVRMIALAARHRLDGERQKLEGVTVRLRDLHPQSVLNRGYAVCWRTADGRIVRRAGQLSVDEVFELQFARGAVTGRAGEIDAGRTLADGFEPEGDV